MKRPGDLDDAGPSEKKLPRTAVEKTAPGVDYQVQLLMFFANQGYRISQQKKDYLFELGTERKDAGKFDDIVVKYQQNQDKKWNYLLIQVKYTTERITTGGLLSDVSNGPFTLLKYFSSFIDTKENHKTEGKIESCVIITNTDFEYDDTYSEQLKLKPTRARNGECGTGPRGTSFYLEVADQDNEIFTTLKKKEGKLKNCKCYKFITEEGIIEELKKEFKKSYNYIKEKRIKNNTDIEITNNLKYLLNNDLDDGTFTEKLKDFLDTLLFMINLPDRGELRQIVKGELGEELCSLDEKIVETFSRKMFEYTVALQKSYLRGSEIEDFFCKAKQSINDILFRPSYYLKIQCSKRIDFQDKSKIKELLHDHCKYIILRITTESMYLTAVKIDKILRDHSNNTNRLKHSYYDKHTFLNLKELYDVNLQEEIIKRFKNADDYLLIIVLDFPSENRKTENFLKELYHIAIETFSNWKKKIVLIDEENSTLDLSFILDDHLQKDRDNANDFSSLTADSKRYLLDKRVIFPAELISLKRLYFKLEDDKSIPSEELDELKIDTKTLESFIKESIKIEKPLSVSNLEEAFSEIYEEVNKNVLTGYLHKSNDTTQESNRFIIGGICGSDKEGQLIKMLQCPNEECHIDKFNLDNARVKLEKEDFTEKEFMQSCRNNPENNLHWIHVKKEDGESKFILNICYDPKFYLKRMFSHFEKMIIKEEFILEEVKKRSCEGTITEDEDSEPVFFFTGEHHTKLAQLTKCKPRNGIILKSNLQETIAKKDFDMLLAKNKHIHWLHVEDNKQIIWRQSIGTLENLHQYIDYKMSSKDVEENNLLNAVIGKKVFIIADEPGMGKSTSLTKLLESASFLKSHWVIRVNLRNYFQTLRKINIDINIYDIVINKIVQFLSDVDSNLSSRSVQELLKSALKRKTFGIELLIAFDGFDEVLDKDVRDKIILLLKFLKDKTNAKVWITTRMHYKNDLENELLTFATKFSPICKERKKEFINKFLKSHLSEKLDDIVRQSKKSNGDTNGRIDFAEAYLEKVECVFKRDKSNFIETPLWLRLTLDGFVQHNILSLKENDNSNPNFDYLGNDKNEVYKRIIDSKYNIYFRKVGVKSTLEKEQTKKIFNEYNKNIVKSFIFKLEQNEEDFKKFKDLVLLAGITKCEGGNGSIKFFHSTFQDYFAALLFTHWIEKPINELSNRSKREVLLTNILLKPDYQDIRTFMNLQFKKIKILPDHQQLYKEIISKSWNENKYKGKTILHVAVEENNTEIINILLDIINATKDDLMQRFLVTRDNHHNTILYLAAKNVLSITTTAKESYGVIKRLLEIAAEYGDDTREKILLATMFRKKQDVKDDTIIHLSEVFDPHRSVKKGNASHIIKELNATFSFNEECILPLKCTYENLNLEKKWNLIKDFLHDVSKESVIAMLKNENNTNIKDYFLKSVTKQGNNILHKAARAGRLESVKLLLEEIKLDVDTKCYKERTGLHKAARDGNKDVVLYLLSKHANINDRDNWGNTPLRDILRSNKLELFFLLKENNFEVNDKDINGYTALHEAVILCNFETVKWLVDEYGDDIKTNCHYENAIDLAEKMSKGDISLEMQDYVKKLRADDNIKFEDLQKIINYLKTKIRQQKDIAEEGESSSS